MKQSHFFWVLAFGAFLIILLIPENQPATQPQNISQVCFGQECFQVELALTPEQQARGLMGRESLQGGMLFVFQEEGIYAFWMKDTLIPLDMIWMDSHGMVVFIKEDAQPCGPVECPTINPGKKARYVLEVSGGTAGRIGLEEGGMATISMN